MLEAHSNYDPYINSMHTPLDMTLSEIRESNKVYKKIINHMMRNRYDRESLYNNERFKLYLKNVLGYNSDEKIYNYMVFRHFYLIEDMNELVKEV